MKKKSGFEFKMIVNTKDRLNVSKMPDCSIYFFTGS